MVHVKDIADKKDPYAAVEELAREYIESVSYTHLTLPTNSRV